jgi:cytochrome d ubiquinol oxidase subunit II
MDSLTQTQQIITFAWWLALGLSLVLYIILDGADLGAGIFSLFVRDEQERGAIMAAMAGTWDANETWLVVAGGVLFGTFPLVYGSAFHYLLIPLAFALWSIITRAVALEFRHHAESSQRFWDWAFGISSLTAVFSAGVAIGAVLKGFPMTSGPVPTYVGGALRFLSPFSVWTGIGAVVAASLAGGLFVRARFEPHCPIRSRAATWVDTTFWLALAAVLVTVIWSVFAFPWASSKWLGPHAWAWVLLGLVTVYAVFRMRRASALGNDLNAILWLNLTIVLMWGGMMATMFPWLVPGTWTIYSGASPSVSLFTFTLAMGGFFPVMIMYNWYQIWVFRARINKLAAYAHH